MTIVAFVPVVLFVLSLRVLLLARHCRREGDSVSDCIDIAIPGVLGIVISVVFGLLVFGPWSEVF